MKDPDIGWWHRSRTTELGAVVLLATAAWLASQESRVLHTLAAAVALLGLTLTLAYHDRRVEREGGRVELLRSWWLFRRWVQRRTTLAATRVKVEVPAGRWWTKRILLVVEGGATPVVLERWANLGQLLFARSLAKRLGRWLEVPVVCATDFTEDPGEPAVRWNTLRNALRTADRTSLRVGSAETDGAGLRAGSPRLQSIVTIGRFVGRRPWIEVLKDHCFVVVGGALLLVVARAPRGLDVLRAVALPIGALLVVEGFRGLIPNGIVNRLGRNGLVVERHGLANELRLLVPFSDVSTVACEDNQQGVPRLILGFEDNVIDLGPRTLGLTTGEFRTFRARFVARLVEWLDDHLQQVPSVDSLEVGAIKRPPHVEYAEARYHPQSILRWLSARFPRLGSLIGVGFLAGTLLFERTLSSRFGKIPAHVSFAMPGVGPYLALKVLAFVICAGAAATLVLAGVRIVWSAPDFRGQIVIWSILILPPLFLTLESGLVGLDIIDAADLCGGQLTPLRFPVERTDTTIQYGPFRSTWTPQAKVYRTPSGAFLRTRDAADHVEVRGALGGHHLVVATEYHGICDSWRSAVSLPTAR